MSSLLSNLNPQQLEAVTLPQGSALILAGAGSGKTRVLTTRVAWLVATGQVSPLGVLAVTFTNKAAREMLTRLSAMLPISVRGMWVGTFHGLCNRMLRAHHRDAGLPRLFTILDTADQLALVKRVYKAAGLDDDKYPPRQLQHFVNGAKEQGLRPPHVEAWDDYTRRMVEIYALYEQALAREGAVDFPELLLRCYELLQKNESLRAHYQSRFAYVLVDEFQDTNDLQYRWLRLLAGPEAAVFAVGDDDQSIYSFRGANVANMQRFDQDFGPARLIKLEQNYRSQGTILEAANALIRHNRARLGKNLWTSEEAGEPVRVFAAPTDVEEAAFVVDAVKALAADGVRLADMAVLYRSNAQSRVIEHALFNSGIAYRVYGGLRYFERAEVKHALAWLRLVASPDDDGAFLRVVNFPPRGIGARTLELLQDAAAAGGVSLARAAEATRVGGRAAASLSAFLALVGSIREQTRELPLPETVAVAVDRSGLLAHYRAEKDGQERVENLEELAAAADAFVREQESQLEASTTPEAMLAEFLAHAALEAGETQAAEGHDALQLMTVHSAKGLEFHAVFVTGLEEGLFPHENSLSERDGVEEERRLMYVAITRARRRLYLTYAQSRSLHGQFRYNVVSRFVEELPAGLLQWLSGGPRNLVPDGDALAPAARRAAHATALAPAPSVQAAAAAGLRIGQSVRHSKFGQGVIVSAEGRGADARVQVNFRDGGLKWLALEYARLEPC